MNLDLFVHPFARQDVRTNSSVFSIFLLEVTKEIEEVQFLRKSTFGSGGPKNRPEMRLFRCFDKKIIYLHVHFLDLTVSLDGSIIPPLLVRSSIS